VHYLLYYTVGLDIDTRAGVKRLWQWFSTWSSKNFTGRRKIVEACLWIVKNKMISKNRNYSTLFCQGVLFGALSFLSFPCLSNQMLEVKVSIRLMCVTSINGPANVVCHIDSGILSYRYYVFTSINAPLHSTLMRVYRFVNTCSKKRLHCLEDAIRGFSSDLFSSRDKDQVVVSVSSKECFLPVSSRKVDTFLLTVQNISSESSTNQVEGSTDVIDFLRQLKPEKYGIYTHITIRFLANAEFLKSVYARIKNEKGNNSNVILNDISKKWFKDTALHLKNGTYEFSSSRRINILKKGSRKTRPLTMGNPRDKVIQKAIQLILEEIYENKEKTFSDVSYAFRPNKSFHTALQQIKNKWIVIPWFISIDTKDAFDANNRGILISCLKVKIRDQRLFKILLKALEAGIISLNGIFKESHSVPQGNILSPILVNIYFHNLDIYMDKEIINRFKKGTRVTRCLDYRRAVSFTDEKKKAGFQKKKQLVREKCRNAHKAGLRYTKLDGSFICVKYVRYANDFLIGVLGSKILVLKIFRSVIFFLKSTLQLHLNEEKSKIIDSFSNKIPFLGMLIHNVSTKSVPFRKSRALQNKKRKLIRVLLRADALENRQTKKLKDECLKLFRNSYKSHRNDRKSLKEDFISLVKGSPTLRDVVKNSNRAIYQEFIQSLLLVSDVQENQTLKDFLNLWKKELSVDIENFKNENSLVIPITKSETIHRVVQILKVQHNFLARKVQWSQLFRNANRVCSPS
jgi:retron-type reverse transcriptase